MATLNDYLLELSYVLGETSVPTSGIDDRKSFINSVRRDIFGRRPWKWATKWNQTVSLTNGAGTLPADYREGGVIDVNDGTNTYQKIDPTEALKYDTGSYVYWVTGNNVDGFTLNTNQTPTSLTVSYATKSTELATSETCPIPLSEPVVKGALVYIRKSENPMAETTAEEAEYEKSLLKLIRLDSQSDAKKRMVSLMETRNRILGE